MRKADLAGTGWCSGMKSQEALVGQVNYNLNKFTQFTLEYIWAQIRRQDW